MSGVFARLPSSDSEDGRAEEEDSHNEQVQVEEQQGQEEALQEIPKESTVEDNEDHVDDVAVEDQVDAQSVGSNASTVVDSDAEEVPIRETTVLERTESELNEFWKEHDLWKSSVKRRSITVGNPTQSPRTLLHPNPPVMFQVTSVPLRSEESPSSRALPSFSSSTSSSSCSSSRASEWVVWRRYSEFEWLRDVLLKRYTGMIIPGLPEKRIVGNAAEDFLRARARGLESFMELVMANAYFATDNTVEMFLSCFEPAQWESYKRSVNMLKPGTKLEKAERNEGRDRWHQALQAYRVPGNAAADIAKIRTELAVLEEVLKGLYNSADRLLSTAEAHAAALGEFGSQLRSNDGSSSRNSLILEQASEPIKRIVGSLGDAFSQWGTVGSCLPSIIDKNLCAALRQELNSVHELTRMLNRREMLLRSIQKHKATLDKLEQEKSALERGHRAERALKFAEKIAQESYALKLADSELQLTTKGIFFTEIDLFVETKVESFREFGRLLSGAFVEFLDALRDSWMETQAKLQ